MSSFVAKVKVKMGQQLNALSVTLSSITTALGYTPDNVKGVTASGTDTYAATYSPAPTSYTEGLRVLLKFTNANTGPATINLNGLGAKSIKKNVSTALAANDIMAGQIYTLAYDGTNFQIVGIGNSTGITDPGGSNDDFLQRKAGAWTNRTIAQVRSDLKSSIVYYKNNVSSSVASSSETVMDDACLIPGGTLQANDVLYIAMIFTKTGTGGGWDVKLKVNTTPVLSGATQIMTSTHGATIMYTGIDRILVFKNSVSSQESFPAAAASQTHLFTSTSAISTHSIDFSVDQYIFPSIDLVTGVDTGTLRNWWIEIIRN